MKTIFSFLALLFVVSTSVNAQMSKDKMMSHDEPTVIKLSQTEGVYETTSLDLAPGQYIFEVTNRNVDKGLGFYLQDGTEAQVENSGLEALVAKGETSRTGVVTLTEGSYNYSCPLNPTPHYQITVSDNAMMAKPTVVELSQGKGKYDNGSIELSAGDYIFAVTNRNVKKDLGFYLQDASEAQVENSGLAELVGKGETSRSGVVSLKPGTYKYSCPLNPTPHYTVTVK